MGLIFSEPMKKVVEIPEILMEISVEDAKNHPRRKNRHRSTGPPKRRGGAGRVEPKNATGRVDWEGGEGGSAPIGHRSTPRRLVVTDFLGKNFSWI
jgi:hypothetical protein